MNTTYDQIIGNYYGEGSLVKNIIIKGGRVKQLSIDDKIIDVQDDIEVVKIRQIDGQTQYYVDKDDLDGFIKVLKCE
jgi:polynucleotide 5'-kinase involved in rRNA processing